MGEDSSSLRGILDDPLLSREEMQHRYGTDRHLRRLLDRTLDAVEVVVDSPLWEDAEAMLDVGQARYGADYRFVRIR